MSSRLRKRDEPRMAAYGQMFFLCGTFLVGAVLGSLLASCLPTTGDGWFASYYLSILSGQYLPSFKGFFLANAFLLTTIFSGAFVKYGLLMIPAAIAVKGMSVSLAITCYISAFGVKGYLPAVFSIFFSSFIVVLALMLLSCQAMEYSHAVARKGSGVMLGRLRFDRSYLLSGFVSLLLVLLAGVVHCYLMPVFTHMTISIIM